MSPSTAPYTELARIYDLLYAGKDYLSEAREVRRLARDRGHGDGASLLDVACGTGGHLRYFQECFSAEGLDCSTEQIAVARERLPDMALHVGDMVDFTLERRFDIITCLFSAIGYVETEAKLHQAVANMARHLVPGGVLLVEPWLDPSVYREGTVHASFRDDEQCKIARMTVSEREGNISVMEMHYMVATVEGVRYFTDLHRIALFTQQQQLDAFEAAGLSATFDPGGLTGRGLCIGVKNGE